MKQKIKKDLVYNIKVYRSVEKKVFEILKELGVSPGRKGYKYLIDAIYIVIHNEKAIHKIGELVYAKIATKHSTKESAVERAIRTAIERLIQDGNIEVIYKMFGNTISFRKGKPTNKEFISLLASKLKLE